MTTATPSAGKRIAHAHYQRSGGQTFPDGKGALANDIDTALRDSQKELVEISEKALLLAARWFKLNFDDDTLNEHPPSKADLAGMFDAMQEARIALAKAHEREI